MSEQADVLESFAGMSLFADLTGPQLEAVAHIFDEDFFDEGTRILRRNFAGSGFYVIIEGEAAVQVDGKQIATLSRGDFFGDMSALLNELPSADVTATRPLRCAVLSAVDLDRFLLDHPTVALRMLKGMARRLRNAAAWRS